MKVVIIFVGTIVVAIIATTLFFLFQAQGMKEFCADIRAGESVYEIRRKVAATYSYKTAADFISNGEQSFFVRANWAIGRINCKVSYSGNHILFTKYVGGD